MIEWDSESEQWVTIPGHPQYQASSLGRIRSARGVLKPWVSNGLGHLKVGLANRKREWVHRLVCLAFHGPCPDGMEVRHLDGDPANNRISNLRYGTHSENMLDRRRHGRLPKRLPADVRKANQLASKRKHVRKQAGVTVECDNCGRQVSKLNIGRHKTTDYCNGRTTGRWQ